MLRITARQMQLFANVMRGSFEDSAIRLLRAEYPKTTGAHPDDKLRHFVRVGIERAARHGVAAVTDVERWLRLMMRLGPTFDEDARLGQVRAILARREVDAQFRLDEIEVLAATIGTARD
jgi:hypothetical protein